MTTPDLILPNRLSSIVISMGGLLRNIWQKSTFARPTLRVSFGLWRVMGRGPEDALSRSRHRLLVLTVTNMGSDVEVVYACIAKPKVHWWGRQKLPVMLSPIRHELRGLNIDPVNSALPTRIDVGEVKNFYFPYAKDSFLSEGLARVGIKGTYHRNTWCRRREMQKASEAYRRNFGRGSLVTRLKRRVKRRFRRRSGWSWY